MRLRLGLAGLALCLLAAGSGTSWIRTSPRGEDFYVSVPVTLSRQESKSETPVGLQRSVIHSASHDHETYVVLRTTYAETLLERIRKEDLLEASQRRLLEDFDARLLGQAEVRIGDWPGREIRMKDNSHKFTSVARLFLVGNEFYTLVGITRRPGFPEANLRRFLDSFELSPSPRP